MTLIIWSRLKKWVLPEHVHAVCLVGDEFQAGTFRIENLTAADCKTQIGAPSVLQSVVDANKRSARIDIGQDPGHPAGFRVKGNPKRQATLQRQK